MGPNISQFAGKELMIKRGALKYQFYENAQSPQMAEVLFDLDADASERVNLINEPRYVKALAGFRARCAQLGFGPDADEAYVNAGYAPLSH